MSINVIAAIEKITVNYDNVEKFVKNFLDREFYSIFSIKLIEIIEMKLAHWFSGFDLDFLWILWKWLHP